MDFSAWVQAKGFDFATLSNDQKTVLQSAWRAENGGNVTATTTAKGDQNESLEAVLAEAKQEGERQSAIANLTRRFISENPGKLASFEAISRAAIAEKWSVQRTELAYLRESYGSGPNVFAPAKTEASDDVIEAALCVSAKLPNAEKQFSANTLEKAHKLYRGRLGLQQAIAIAARQNGWRGESVKDDLRNALRYANAPDNMRAAVGPSTISVTGILSNTANKFLREAFMFVEQEWRKISAIRPVSDFKTITSYSLTGDNSYDKVAPGGELKHGTLGEETYTNRADSYGKFMGIDRRDIINDDLGAFQRVGNRLGRGGALKLNEVFWAEFLADHSTFFPTDGSLLNYDAGTDTAFGSDGLATANALWHAKTDPDGKPLGADARILLVPVGHEIAAQRLLRSQTYDYDSNSGIANPWASRFELCMSRYLSNSSMGGGYSALAWYLLADPRDIPVIETVFLNGVEMPTIETVEMDADRLGMAMRAYWDFGVNKQEYRAGYKFKGEA